MLWGAAALGHETFPPLNSIGYPTHYQPSPPLAQSAALGPMPTPPTPLPFDTPFPKWICSPATSAARHLIPQHFFSPSFIPFLLIFSHMLPLPDPYCILTPSCRPLPPPQGRKIKNAVPAEQSLPQPPEGNLNGHKVRRRT